MRSGIVGTAWLVLGLVAFVACDDDDGPTDPPGGSNGENVVTLSGTSFSPSTLTIEPGETVTWVNQNGEHTVTPDDHDEWDREVMDSDGQEFEVTFENEGEFEYFCEPHLQAGMTGVIRVEE